MLLTWSPTDEPPLTRILVVDDDAADRETLRRTLAAAAITASIDDLPAGEDVVARITSQAYDCIVLDEPADQTGLDVIARIRAAGVATPILCVAELDDEGGAALVAAGATEFLARSDLSPDRLARRLRFALRLARAEQHATHARAQFDAHRRLLDAVVAQLPNGLAVVDAAMTEVLLVNPQAEQILDGGGADLVSERPSGLAAHARPVLEAALGTGELATHEAPVEHDRRHFRLGAAPVHDETGAITAGVIVLDDVTEVTRATAEAERSIRAYQNVLAIVSHDLRGPLSAINLAVDALADDTVVGPQRERYATSGRDAVQRANRLIRNLLTAEEIEAGTLRPLVERVHLPKLLDEAAREHELLAARTGTSIVTSVGRGTIAVHADRDQLLQVLANLITNALRYARGAGPIELAARSANGRVEVSVRDHGPGIPEEARAHVFERYGQGRERRGGAGLGLAIVRGIVRSHGGEVTVSRTPGGGATFTLSLPADVGA